MGSDLTYEQYNVEKVLAQPTPRASIVTAALQQFCPLYTKFQPILDQVGQGALSPTAQERLLSNTICGIPNAPPPNQTVPFPGGQCPGVLYQANFGFTTINGGSAPYCTTVSVHPVQPIIKLFGPIGAIVYRGSTLIPGDCARYGYIEAVISCAGTEATGIQPVGLFQLLGGSAGTLLSVDSFSLSPLDANPVTLCGSQSPSYPDPQLHEPDFTSTPIIHFSPTLSVAVPVTINKTVVNNSVTNRPELNISVGDTNVNFSMGGVTFSANNFEANNSFTPPAIKIFPNPPTKTVTPPSGGASTPTDLTPVLTAIAVVKTEVEDCCERYHPFNDIPAANSSQQSLGSGNSGTFTLPPNTYRVSVQITSPLGAISGQSGGIAPNVYYAGWAWFDTGNGMTERFEIDSAFKSFIPPEWGALKFSFTCKKNYTCSVTAYIGTKTYP
jgi:hypothetical protein